MTVVDRTVPCKLARVAVQSNKLEKFNLAAKLVHELAANVHEDFKRFCHRQEIDISHIFKIMRIDYTKINLEIEFVTDDTGRS